MKGEIEKIVLGCLILSLAAGGNLAAKGEVRKENEAEWMRITKDRMIISVERESILKDKDRKKLKIKKIPNKFGDNNKVINPNEIEIMTYMIKPEYTLIKKITKMSKKEKTPEDNNTGQPVRRKKSILRIPDTIRPPRNSKGKAVPEDKDPGKAFYGLILRMSEGRMENLKMRRIPELLQQERLRSSGILCRFVTYAANEYNILINYWHKDFKDRPNKERQEMIKKRYIRKITRTVAFLTDKINVLLYRVFMDRYRSTSIPIDLVARDLNNEYFLNSIQVTKVLENLVVILPYKDRSIKFIINEILRPILRETISQIELEEGILFRGVFYHLRRVQEIENQVKMISWLKEIDLASLVEQNKLPIEIKKSVERLITNEEFTKNITLKRYAIVEDGIEVAKEIHRLLEKISEVNEIVRIGEDEWEHVLVGEYSHKDKETGKIFITLEYIDTTQVEHTVLKRTIQLTDAVISTLGKEEVEIEEIKRIPTVKEEDVTEHLKQWIEYFQEEIPEIVE